MPHSASQPDERNLEYVAQEFAGFLLSDRGAGVVFAESCTAGLVAAALAAHPGISRRLCGSAVTYRDLTKSQWLDIDPALIAIHTSVSAAVTEEMAVRVLNQTSEADWSAAVTGHLGPDAPPQDDGAVFVAIGMRTVTPRALSSQPEGKPKPVAVLVESGRFQLRSSSRADRQREAAAIVLSQLHVRMREAADDDSNRVP